MPVKHAGLNPTDQGRNRLRVHRVIELRVIVILMVRHAGPINDITWRLNAE